MQQMVIRFFNSNETFSVTKLLKQHWKQNRYSYRTNPRPDYGLMLLLHGSVKLSSENETLAAEAGDVLFLPKNSHYEAIFEQDATDLLVNFNADVEFPTLSKPILLLKNAPISCADKFQAIISEQISVHTSTMRIKGQFWLLLDELLRCILAYSSSDEQLIAKAKALLQSEDDFKIPEIARRCGISESGFRQKFHKTAGISPAEYRLTFRLEKAKYLLESTELSVSEIADLLHFYDAAYFCKVFKAYTGTTPKAFAKSKQL